MKHKNNESILISEPVKTETQAVDEKMKALTYKLFGIFNPMPYKLLSKRKVFVPYELLVFSYTIGSPRNGQKPGMFGKSGKIAIVFDVNEVHGFHFDLSEKLHYKTLDQSAVDGEILPDRCSKTQILEKSKDTIRFRYLNRHLGRNCDLELLERTRFYRPAVELTVKAHEKEMTRFAYLDRFASSNENINGLKIRLGI